jgi:hypothetical protein
MPVAARHFLFAFAALLTVLTIPRTAEPAEPSIALSDDGQELRAGETPFTVAARGTVSALWVDVYDCALFLPRPLTSLDELRAPDLPVAAGIFIRIDDTLAELPRRWRTLLRREVDAATYARLQEVSHDLSRGDYVMLVYRPDAGTGIFHNGQPVARVAGKSLMNAVLAQWLGDDPVSEKLRATLTAGLQAMVTQDVAAR